MTAQPHNRFVFCVVVAEFAVNGNQTLQAFYTKTNGGDSYFLFHALLVFFIEYCHKLCIQRQMVVRRKHVSYFLYGKY